MTTAEPALRWTDLDAFAARRQFTRNAVLNHIHAGNLTGLFTRSGWYVLEQLVAVEIPDPRQQEHARLHVTGRLDGEWLTVCGSMAVVLELTYDESIRTAIGALYDPDRPQPPAPIPLTLNDQKLTVDGPLQADLLAALVEWQVEVELGDLFKQDRPDGQSMH